MASVRKTKRKVSGQKSQFKYVTSDKFFFAMQKTQLDIEHITEKLDRLMSEIFGNGKEGLKTDIVKLRQVMKLCVCVAITMGGLMIADFVKRVYEDSPTDVKIRFEEESKADRDEIKALLKEIVEK